MNCAWLKEGTTIEIVGRLDMDQLPYSSVNTRW
jgi:hypothetical protein